MSRRANRTADAGLAALHRYHLHGDPVDLRAAIAAFLEAADELPRGHPYRAGFRQRAGSCLQLLFELAQRFERSRGARARLPRVLALQIARGAPHGVRDVAHLLGTLRSGLPLRAGARVL